MDRRSAIKSLVGGLVAAPALAVVIEDAVESTKPMSLHDQMLADFKANGITDEALAEMLDTEIYGIDYWLK